MPFGLADKLRNRILALCKRIRFYFAQIAYCVWQAQQLNSKN